MEELTTFFNEHGQVLAQVLTATKASKEQIKPVAEGIRDRCSAYGASGVQCVVVDNCCQ